MTYDVWGKWFVTCGSRARSKGQTTPLPPSALVMQHAERGGSHVPGVAPAQIAHVVCLMLPCRCGARCQSLARQAANT
eukprot:211545-Alexandrium_andersonii.AAC.1